MNKLFLKAMFMVSAAALSANALALPSLQLGPGDGTWDYVGGGDDTWYVTEDDFSMFAYANSLDGNGDYGFTESNTDRTAYLVFSLVPKSSTLDPDFALNVTDSDGNALTLVEERYGTAPLADDANEDLASHGIFDTYYFVYEFDFDGSVQTIYDTADANGGSGNGYAEEFFVSLNTEDTDITGIHMDLFSVFGDTTLNTGRKTTDGDGKFQVGELNEVYAFAPFSHDAQWTVPEPNVALLFGMGLLGLIGVRHRKAA